MSKLLALKSLQLAEAEKTGINPYLLDDHPEMVPAPDSFGHYQAAMSADLASLKELKTLEEKQAAKRNMLPAYLSFVDDYVAQGHDYPNDIAVQVMIWLLDVGEIESGLNLALTLIKRGNQIMPAKFDRRDLETFVCDAVYDWANELLKKDQSANPYLQTTVDALRDGHWDVHPAVASKMFVMLAKHRKLEGDWQAVFDYCNLAETVNPEGAGVKTLRQEALAKIKVT